MNDFQGNIGRTALTIFLPCYYSMYLYLPLITNGLLCPATSNNPALELK